MNSRTGILLVNLGTPDSPKPKDVYKYLIEFLTDGRVIDMPWLSRQLLVRGLIVPARYKQSAKSYQEIWTPEGSPLKVYGLRVESKLQESLGENYLVKLAMRYQEPSIEKGLQVLLKANIERLIVFPLFPHYASATTGSVHQKVAEELKRHLHIPETIFVNQFATDAGLIKAFCEVSRPYQVADYDHILFSFHGLPQKHITKIDRSGSCLNVENCCQTYCERNRTCYSAQSYATAREIALKLGIPQERYTICFQSRLGKDPWLQPFTSETISRLAKEGKKRVLVFCPAFVCDCLETIYEIGIEYAAEFKHAGGEQLDLVPGLNDHPQWIQALQEMILSYEPRHAYA